MNALLLAAGFGTRFKPHTLRHPKAAMPVLNIPLMAFSLQALENLGLDRLVVNTHHLHDKVVECTERVTRGAPYEVIFSHERDQIMDSGGGIKFAEHHLIGNDWFAVANADSSLLFSHPNILKDIKRFHLERQALCTIVTIEHPDAGKRLGGVWADENGKIYGVGKTRPTPLTKPYHYIGLMLFSDSIFKFFPEGPCNIFLDVINPLIKTGAPIYGFNSDQINWRDMESESDLLNGTSELLGIINDERDPYHKYLSFLFRRYCPGGMIKNQIVIGKGATMAPSAKGKGFLVLGNEVHLPEKCRTENVIIADGVSLMPNTVISNKLVLP